MFVTGPPDRPGAGGLCLRGTARRVFDGSSDLATDPSLRPYLEAMAAPYGLPLREEVFAAADGHSYGEMAQPLIDELVTGDTPVDLLVMAYDVHDVRLGRSTTTYLSGHCPGNPFAFALCDQGVAGPFAELRAMHAYGSTGGCRRALLLVVEQSALHYEPAEPVRLPDRHTAVAFLAEWSAGNPAAPAPAVRQYPGATPELVTAELAALLPDGGRDTTVVVGANLAARWTGDGADDVVVADPGRPCTGVWWELSARLPAWQARGRHVVLAEFDPLLGYLCAADLWIGGAERATPEVVPAAHQHGRASGVGAPSGVPTGEVSARKGGATCVVASRVPSPSSTSDRS